MPARAQAAARFRPSRIIPSNSTMGALNPCARMSSVRSCNSSSSADGIKRQIGGGAGRAGGALIGFNSLPCSVGEWAVAGDSLNKRKRRDCQRIARRLLQGNSVIHDRARCVRGSLVSFESLLSGRQQLSIVAKDLADRRPATTTSKPASVPPCRLAGPANAPAGLAASWPIAALPHVSCLYNVGRAVQGRLTDQWGGTFPRILITG